MAQEVAELQARCGIEPSVLPHVTVKAQPGLEDPDLWEPAVAAVTAATSPFDVQLGPTGSFGDGIVFLSVESPALIQLPGRILEALGDQASPSDPSTKASNLCLT